MADLDPVALRALLGSDGESEPPTPPAGISATAEAFGVSHRTLRFYETLGFLTPERNGAKRLYSARDRRRLRVALFCRQIGLTLAEAGEIIEIGEMPCGVQQRAEAIIKRFTEQRPRLMAELSDIDAALAAMDTARAFLEGKLPPPKRRTTASPQLEAR